MMPPPKGIYLSTSIFPSRWRIR